MITKVKITELGCRCVGDAGTLLSKPKRTSIIEAQKLTKKFWSETTVAAIALHLKPTTRDQEPLRERRGSKDLSGRLELSLHELILAITAQEDEIDTKGQESLETYRKVKGLPASFGENPQS